MYTIILIIHVVIGSIALLSGAGAIISKKGGKPHKKSGKIYYLCMYAVAVSAFVLTIIRPNPFLMSIAIFAFYLTYSGKRAIDNWRLRSAYSPTIKDRIPFYIALLTALFMIGFPVTQMILAKQFFVSIMAILGAVMLYAAVKDIGKYSDASNFQPGNKKWLTHHISMMGGAYIATFTAFLVNNVRMEPFWVPWLAPGAVGSLLITYANIQWRKKLKINEKPVLIKNAA